MAHDSDHEVSPGQRAAEVANLGLIRPPFVYLGSIGLGLLVHSFWPVQLLPARVSVPIGVTVVLVAGTLFISAVRTFRKAGTPIPGNRPTTTIVRTGPYAFSRNPIYLAFTLLQVGLAAWVNSLGVLLTLFPALALMVLVVIPREERYLEARFPSEYLSYKRAVRRWLQKGPFRHPPEGFVLGVIGDRAVRCISAEIQEMCHLGYEPKEKDVHDLSLLHRAFGTERPPPYRGLLGEND